MSKTETSTESYDEPGLYEIRLKGHLEKRWALWFEGMTITLEENGDTLLTGLVVDQPALHGLLRKVRDLGMPLVTVIHVEPKQANGPDVNADADHNRSQQQTNIEHELPHCNL